MQTSSTPPLFRRVGAMVRAKQYLVFFAVFLTALDVAATVLTAELVEHRSLGAVLDTSSDPIRDALTSHAPLVALVALATVALTAALRCAYIRSLTGGMHWGPRDARQLVSMFALLLLLGLGFAAIGAAVSSDDTSWRGAVGVVAALALVVVGLYADYAVVLASAGPLHAIRRSLQAVRSSLSLSFLVVLLGSSAGVLFAPLITGRTTSGVSLLPAVVIWVLVQGTVSFLLDVVLICNYLELVENDRLPAD